jgi:hypothetical protein
VLVHLPLWNVHDYVASLSYIHETDPKVATASDLGSLMHIVRNPGRWVTAVVLSGLGFVLFRSHGSAKFTQAYNMGMLRKTEVNNWPQIP